MSHSDPEPSTARPRRELVSRLLPVLVLGLVVVAAVAMLAVLLQDTGDQASAPPASTSSSPDGGEVKSADAESDDAGAGAPRSAEAANGDGAAEPAPPAAAPDPAAAPPSEPIKDAAKPGSPKKKAKPALSEADLPYQIAQVFYATNRKRTGLSDPNSFYSGDRGTSGIIVYGACTVSIPKDHRVGEMEAPSLMRLEFSEVPEQHVVLLTVAEQDRAAFYGDIASRIAASKGKNAFIFVHGYNVSFKDAARRTAQMAYDLKFDGAPVFFSWPSQGTMLGYKYDEANVEWAEAGLKTFIKEFVQTSSAENLYLVAHSMGSRALTAAVKDLFAETPEIKTKIREIILAAPDIDADVFKTQIAPTFAGEQSLVTLYASSKDLALTLSKTFNGYPRAGDSGSSIVVVPGIDTIEASDVETDFLGHSYFMQSTSIIGDIFHIIGENVPPDQRPHLKSVTDASGSYWKMVRSAEEPAAPASTDGN